MTARLSSCRERESIFTSPRGIKLWTYTIAPEGQAKTLMVYHHGFGEHCHRHLRALRHLAEKLQAVVVTYDVHGHGRSAPFTPALRAYVKSWKHLLTDLFAVIEQVALPAAKEYGVPEGQLFLMGHSMGGMASMLAAIQRPGFFKGVLLSSPLVSVTPKQSWGEWAQIAVLRLLNLVVPTKPFIKRRALNTVLRDPQAVKEVASDTLWYRDPIKVGTVVSCINGTLVIQARAHKLTTPLYIQQGTLDLTCSVVALRRLLPRIGSTDVTYHEVQGGLHDLLLDTETPQLLERMAEFVRTHM